MNVVCIPAYNEEAKIKEVVKKALLYVDKVIVCDDGSTDNTAVLSVEPSSHTMTLSTCGNAFLTTSLIFLSSLYAGIQTTFNLINFRKKPPRF